MPILQRFLREPVDMDIVTPSGRVDPVRLRIQQHVNSLGRMRQRRVDGRRMRMHQLGPVGVEQPQRAAAARAEMPASGTDAAFAIVLANAGTVDAHMLAALDVQRVGPHPDVDRAAAAARGLATDRAVAMQERRRRVRLAAETHLTAMAGSFDVHGGVHPVRRRADASPRDVDGATTSGQSADGDDKSAVRARSHLVVWR